MKTRMNTSGHQQTSSYLNFTRVLLLAIPASLAASCGKASDPHAEVQATTTDNMISTAVQPTDSNRNFTCPVEYSTADAVVNGKAVTFQKADQGRAAQWDGLEPILNPIKAKSNLKATLILVRRIKGQKEPTYFYLSNSTQNDAFQTWSSSKFIAFTMASAALRQESQSKVGLDGFVQDHQGNWVSAGDLASSITVYRDIHRAGKTYHSNNLGTFMQNVSGRNHSQSLLLSSWLQRPSESFKGGYNGGEGDSTGLRPIFKSQSGKVHQSQFSSAGAGRNHLSTFTFAETLKRLVMFREDASTRIPHVKWEDLQTLFYGAQPGQSVYFKDKTFGGMQGGASSFTVQPFGGFGSQKINQDTQGKWRHISKIGYGNDEALYHAYTCVPKLNAEKQVVGGVEFILSIRNKGNFLNKRDPILRQAAVAVTEAIRSGKLVLEK
jgi:hypothetical protein